jgi:signal transduction histidine kinase
MLVLGTFVPEKQALLFVGQSTAELDDLKSFIARSFIWSATTTCGLAIAFGLVTASAFLRRVEAVNTAAASIMAGDLAHRVPVRGTNDEFDRLSQNLNHMLDRIDHLFEQLRQVSNDIAHDLRTPLSRLRQGLETARAKAQSVETYASAIDDAIEQTNEIISIFGALLRIAQIEADMNTQELRPTDLSEIFGRVYGAYESVAEDQGKYLVQRIESGIVILGDDHLLTQMVSNLVENALCHTLPSTTITVQLTRGSTSVVGLIADNGPGIPEESRDKVFQRFVRLDRSRSTPGSGLGLSLVAAIAGMHGIAITLSDNEPGLRVTLSFPHPESWIDFSATKSSDVTALHQAAASVP